jgi:hypothetical protein
MTKQIIVDVERSLDLGYQENGRVKAIPKQDYAHILVKKFYCASCGYTLEIGNNSFGEGILCPDCKVPMIQR